MQVIDYQSGSAINYQLKHKALFGGFYFHSFVCAALLLDVMPGDEVDIEVWAYNQSGISTGTSRISCANLVAALVSAFVPSGSGTDLYTQTNSVFTGVVLSIICFGLRPGKFKKLRLFLEQPFSFSKAPTYY